MEQAMKYRNIALLTGFSLLMCGAAWANSATVTVNVSCTILPLFEMEVTGPAGGHIEFGSIKKDPDQNVSAAAPEVVIRANSNLGQPYMITHELIAPLSSDDGAVLPDGSMSVNATAANGSAAKSQAVGTDTEVLYHSDAGGKSDIITARYDLDVHPDQDAGQYRSKLLYTIVTV
jgi:hypothetical protein